MDQTDDQQTTNQSQGVGTMPPMPPIQPQTPAPVVPVVDSTNKIDMSTQQDINPDDLRNKLNETLSQIPPVSADPVSTGEPVQTAPVAARNAVSEQQPIEHVAPIGASVIVYTIENCPFCKAEKDYLTAHAIPFEEKRVDSNEANLKEMLALSDNFAGVPVTHLKGASSQRVVKGFTEAEFAQELLDVGFLKPEEMPQPRVSEAVVAPQAPVMEQSIPQPVQEEVVIQQPVMTTSPSVPAEPIQAPAQSVAQVSEPASQGQTPTIPDFPQK